MSDLAGVSKKQSYFPYCDVLELSPKVYDYFDHSFKEINKRHTDIIDTICLMEKRLASEYNKKIRSLEERLELLELKLCSEE